MRGLFYILCLAFISLVSCSGNNNVTIDKTVAAYFDSAGLKGCFGLFNNTQGEFNIHELRTFKDSAYQPASTFNIVMALIGIETGVLPNETAVSADSAGNTNLKDAFSSSSTDYFTRLAKHIGRDTLQRWMDSLGYGRRYARYQLQNHSDNFWMDNSLKITADEQLGLVKKLYFNQLPFSKRSQQIVSRLMLREENANYKLCYATGSGTTEKSESIQWLLGWIEENRHPYFFVLQLRGANGKNNQLVSSLKKILGKEGFFLGRK